MSLLRKFWSDCSGVTAIEYGLIAGLLSITILTVLFATRDSVISLYGTITEAVTAAASQ
jgi:pilus assembly protein Flp/PilA